MLWVRISLCVITGILSATLHNSSFPSSRKLDTQAEEPRGRKEGRGEGRSLAQDWIGYGLRGAWPSKKVCSVLTGWTSQTSPYRYSRKWWWGVDLGVWGNCLSCTLSCLPEQSPGGSKVRGSYFREISFTHKPISARL